MQNRVKSNANPYIMVMYLHDLPAPLMMFLDSTELEMPQQFIAASAIFANFSQYFLKDMKAILANFNMVCSLHQGKVLLIQPDLSCAIFSGWAECN
jgi:hypothetical protein